MFHSWLIPIFIKMVTLFLLKFHFNFFHPFKIRFPIFCLFFFLLFLIFIVIWNYLLIKTAKASSTSPIELIHNLLLLVDHNIPRSDTRIAKALLSQMILIQLFSFLYTPIKLIISLQNKHHQSISSRLPSLVCQNQCIPDRVDSLAVVCHCSFLLQCSSIFRNWQRLHHFAFKEVPQYPAVHSKYIHFHSPKWT